VRATTQPLLDWLAGTGCSPVAEFIPRQVIHLRQLLTGFPLLRSALP
jgi:hypothetical protein